MSQIAHRYAKALFDTACEQNDLEVVHAALTNVASLTLSLQDFQRFLNNPLLSFEERNTILKALFEGKVPDLVYRFLLFITYKNRLTNLKDIIEAFDDLYLSSTHQLRAFVTTAFPVKDDDKTFIDKCLQDKFHMRMVTRWELDASLLGGFRILAQGCIYDYSFKSQLDHFLAS